MTDSEFNQINAKIDKILSILEEKSAGPRHSSEIEAIAKGKVLDLKIRRERRMKGHGCATPGDR